MTTHSTIPAVSRICHSRPRSRYSHPCAPTQNQGPLLCDEVLEAGGLPGEAPQDDHHQCPEQQQGEFVLPLRLVAGDHGSDEDSHGQEAGRDEEEGELHMPHAREVVGKPVGDGNAVEPPRLGMVVGVHPAQETLAEEEPSHDQEVPGDGPLRRGQAQLLRRPEPAGPGALLVVPAELLEAAEGEEDEARPAQKGDQAEDAPKKGRAGGAVSGQALRRPVVGVGVTRPGAQGRAGPGRPGEKGGEAPDLMRGR